MEQIFKIRPTAVLCAVNQFKQKVSSLISFILWSKLAPDQYYSGQGTSVLCLGHLGRQALWVQGYFSISANYITGNTASDLALMQ